MICGYCECGFPAIHKCTCGARLCNTCFQSHKCKVEEKPGNEPVEAIPEKEEKPEDDKAPVLDYKRKPGRPSVRK